MFCQSAHRVVILFQVLPAVATNKTEKRRAHTRSGAADGGGRGEQVSRQRVAAHDCPAAQNRRKIKIGNGTESDAHACGIWSIANDGFGLAEQPLRGNMLL